MLGEQVKLWDEWVKDHLSAERMNGVFESGQVTLHDSAEDGEIDSGARLTSQQQKTVTSDLIAGLRKEFGPKTETYDTEEFARREPAIHLLMTQLAEGLMSREHQLRVRRSEGHEGSVKTEMKFDERSSQLKLTMTSKRWSLDLRVAERMMGPEIRLLFDERR